MFTRNRHTVPQRAETEPPERRGRGRPRGRTEHGQQVRERIYRIALRHIARRGYDHASLRDVAEKAEVSPALVYKYFPSKRAIVLALYDELSLQFADTAVTLPSGTWRRRFLHALELSLASLRPHRTTLSALIPLLVSTGDESLFAPGTAFSRDRVQGVFLEAVKGASDAPPPDDAHALGTMLYVTHLGVLMWWLLDRSPEQRATDRLLSLLGKVMPVAQMALKLPGSAGLVRSGNSLVREALLGEVDENDGRRR